MGDTSCVLRQHGDKKKTLTSWGLQRGVRAREKKIGSFEKGSHRECMSWKGVSTKPRGKFSLRR